MEDPRIQALLDKHAANNITQEELAELHRWYDAFPQQGLPQGKAVAGREMRLAVDAVTREGKNHSRRQSIIRAWSAAAAAMVLIAGAWWWMSGGSKAPVMVEIQVPAGDSMRTVQLPDGSRAWLSAGSTIRYREGFEGGERMVWLPDGQVFFETGKATEHPFTVKTGKGVEVKVLGTGFSVTSWPELPQTEVFVETGAVQVSDSTGVITVLRAKESIGYTPGKPLPKRTDDRPDPRSGVDALKDADFATVAAFVKRRFGWELRYDQQRHETVRFNVFAGKDMTPQQFFELLQLLSGIPFRTEGKSATFFSS